MNSLFFKNCLSFFTALNHFYFSTLKIIKSLKRKWSVLITNTSNNKCAHPAYKDEVYKGNADRSLLLPSQRGTTRTKCSTKMTYQMAQKITRESSAGLIFLLLRQWDSNPGFLSFVLGFGWFAWGFFETRRRLLEHIGVFICVIFVELLGKTLFKYLFYNTGNKSKRDYSFPFMRSDVL